MTDQIPVKAIRTGSTVTALAEFENGDQLPFTYLPITGATAIAVVATLPASPDPDTIYITTT